MLDVNGIPQQQLLSTVRRGTTAQQPAANKVVPGTLYYDTTLTSLFRSNGVTWESYSGGAGSLTYQAAGGSFTWYSFGHNGLAADMLFSGTGVGNTSGAWPTANLAIWLPVIIWAPCTVDQLGIFNGATANSNIDLGIYHRDNTLLVSTGAFAQAGTNAYQFTSVTPTDLSEGLHFFACSFSATTGTIFRQGTLAAGLSSTIGVLQEASAHPLPSTGTPVVALSDFVYSAVIVGEHFN